MSKELRTVVTAGGCRFGAPPGTGTGLRCRRSSQERRAVIGKQKDRRTAAADIRQAAVGLMS